MSNATKLTKEQARAIKKSTAVKRTVKRFDYINAAVPQAAILGDAKLVFVILLRKGTSKWDTSIYRVIEIDTKKVPTIYTLAKFRRLQKQRRRGGEAASSSFLSPTESVPNRAV